MTAYIISNWSFDWTNMKDIKNFMDWSNKKMDRQQKFSLSEVNLFVVWYSIWIQTLNSMNSDL